MIETIIIDDEEHCIKALKHDLDMFCPQVKVIDTCKSAKEALLSIKKNKPSLIFLDVEMPWMNGFEMLEVLGDSINFHIIFTTAYDQFAIKAFKVSAIDYLLKPVDGNDLQAAVDKVSKAMQVAKNNSAVSNMMQNSHLLPEQQKIAIPNKDGYEFVETGTILYCKAEGAYTEIVFEQNRRILLSKSLGETENMLPAEMFERIHHSILVNLSHIDQYKRTNGSYIVMKNGDELNVSKSKKENLFARLRIK